MKLQFLLKSSNTLVSTIQLLTVAILSALKEVVLIFFQPHPTVLFVLEIRILPLMQLLEFVIVRLVSIMLLLQIVPVLSAASRALLSFAQLVRLQA